MTAATLQAAPEAVRRRIAVRGLVQGVGFRPFVYRLAKELALRGWVCNSGAGVDMELQGSLFALQAFLTRLRSEAPPLARIASIEQFALPAIKSPSPFFIADSRADAVRTAIVPDAVLCAECLGELFDPLDRRFRYPFITCVNCGPRFSIADALPFDRVNTSMAGFPQCPACQWEYENPSARRFHAQANACPRCGPRLSFHDAVGGTMAVSDVAVSAMEAIRGGYIVALKGLGGFHLVCDARNAPAVARMRERKGREAKPFAVMAANVSSLSPYVSCDQAARRSLESTGGPITLLEKTEDCDGHLSGVAPGLGHLGVMLPYTPLHYLLFHEAAGSPAGTAWLQAPQALLLVCTSANAGGEPLVIDDSEAVTRLQGMADFFVMHDRVIRQRCDDSVIKWIDGAPRFIRRARGLVPQTIKMPRNGPTVLALGGDLKNTLCLTHGDEAYLSQHNGDLDNASACLAVEEALRRLIRALSVTPDCVVHDLHPDFFSSRLAQRFAAEHDLPCFPVQHHHAHIAAVIAEYGLEGPVLGLALDGLGWGDDGGLWGGELLQVEGARSRRLGHLLPLALPGGDRAAREPWRMAASALHALGCHDEIRRRFTHLACDVLIQMLDKSLNAPLTSSAGRWFDAAAGLLGLADRTSYEGQAAMSLETLAMRHGTVAPEQDSYIVEHDGVLNLLPLLACLAREQDSAYGAALFHAGLVAGLSEWVQRAAIRESISYVALSGGCFVNQILTQGLCAALRTAGLKVYMPQQLPVNDGGLSLGQAWVGMQRGMAVQAPAATASRRSNHVFGDSGSID